MEHTSPPTHPPTPLFIYLFIYCFIFILFYFFFDEGYRSYSSEKDRVGILGTYHHMGEKFGRKRSRSPD